MRRRLQQLLLKAFRALNPAPPDQRHTIDTLAGKLAELAGRENAQRAAFMERLAELREARAMAGVGPWLGHAASTDRVMQEGHQAFDHGPLVLREANLSAQGAYGDIELALQNVEWRREVNLSWLEFSRWGIQQLILVCRLYYIKNPIIRRLIDVCAAYVFARGVEVSSTDEDANEVLREFFRENKQALGLKALAKLERQRDTDGNIFLALFPDRANTGKVKCRSLDPTEIQEIITDPEDVDTPWFYRRVWSKKDFDLATGQQKESSGQRWYPALGHEPAEKPPVIGGIEVAWDTPVYHSKSGDVAKWHFGCPRIYPAIDWAKESRKFLEACASVKQALSQIAMTLTTKGGQQAIMGAKEQLSTQTGLGANLWDPNPPSVPGSTFASGPGTTLAAFQTRGAGSDPEEVRQYKLMCCMVAGVPETFLADVSTGNLATATSLDRPTETAFLEKQEHWREDLTAICTYVLKVSLGAPQGRLREALQRRVIDPEVFTIREADGHRDEKGRWVYEAKQPERDVADVRVQFPAIREGDIPALVGATVQAMTLGTQGVAGIDEKEGVRHLGDLLGIEDTDEMVEAMYPEATYEADRTLEPDEPEVPAEPPAPGLLAPDDSVATEEAQLARVIGRLREALNAASHE